MERTAAVVGLALCVLFLGMFGSMFFIGVMNPRNVSSVYGGEGCPPGAACQVTGSMGYHTYNPFAATALVWGIVVGIVIMLWSLFEMLSKKNVLLVVAIGTMGVVLLFASNYIFISGVHDLLTAGGSATTYTKPTLGQQYGWLIETIIFLPLSLAIMGLADWLRRREGSRFSVLAIGFYAMGTFCALVCAVLFAMGVFMLLNGNQSNYQENLAFIPELFIFGVMCVAYLKGTEIFKRGEPGAKSPYVFPAYVIGGVLLVAALAALIFGSLDFVYNDWGSKSFNWLVETAIYGAVGFGLAILSDVFAGRAGEKGIALNTSLYACGGILLFASLLQFIFGLNDFLYSSSPNFKWLAELFVLLVPGAIATVLAVGVELLARMMGGKEKRAKRK